MKYRQSREAKTGRKIPVFIVSPKFPVSYEVGNFGKKQ